MHQDRARARGGDDPLYAAHRELTANGTKPNLEKVTLARRIAATVFRMRKDEEVYQPECVHQGSRGCRRAASPHCSKSPQCHDGRDIVYSPERTWLPFTRVGDMLEV